MSSVAFGTVVTKQYLAFARVLCASLRRFHPAVPCFVALADEADGRFDPEAEPATMLSLADLAIPDLHQLRFRSTQQELACVAKPYLLHTLLERGFAQSVFFDPDILVLNDLSPLLARVAQHALVLTPHLLQPPSGRATIERELNIVRSGVFNGGFVGASDRPETRRFLAWWGQRLLHNCRHDVGAGVYYDQSWLGLAPSLVADCATEHDPGYNVAYWNLPERPLRVEAGQFVVADRPCRFFHFSGFDPRQPDTPNRHYPGQALADTGAATALYEHYRQLLLAAGYNEAASWPYSYGQFRNGVPIPEIARRLYATWAASRAHAGALPDDPFATEQPDSFYEWLQQPADLPPAPTLPISRLWYAIYQQRADLQAAFPDLAGTDRRAFLAWAIAQGKAEHAVADALCFELPPSADELRRLEEERALRARIASVATWYHRIPLGAGIVTPGSNDCATTLERLNLPEDCRGLRVLDLGTRDGFFAFELERRGAEVVAVDYFAAERSGFAVAADILGYRGSFVQENIYNLSAATLGTFDIVLFLGLLYHLPDPIRALRIVHSLCRGQLYLETAAIDQRLPLPDGTSVTLEALAPPLRDVPLMLFMRGHSSDQDPTNYWAPNMKCLELMLTESMFEVLSQQLYDDRAIVACRRLDDPRLAFYGGIASGALLPGGS